MPQIADTTELLFKKMLASRVMLKIHTEKDLENLKVLEKQAVEKHTPIYTQQQYKKLYKVRHIRAFLNAKAALLIYSEQK